ncbi:Uroporphyrinogen-III C-methyltransferase [Nocardioides aquaticus]|uniref:Uroporphyrinogen-III C-methyltransferase n=2 Tax=Nocardioidaceae TaxID=85015 RepID=A0ABX8EFF3_9ACTN|nr:Uroporphyrinogen-III C-methyltransferase [Nocardioides aquaticus]
MPAQEETTRNTTEPGSARVADHPLQMDVVGAKALVLGGDEHAAVDVARLLSAGAHVTVHATRACAYVEDLATRCLITWVRHEATLEEVVSADLTLRPRLRSQPRPAGLDEKGAQGQVTLVGGGPGAVDLMTLAGREAIAKADVVVIDRLAPWEALTWARPDAEIVDVAKIPFGRFTSQEEINRILVDRALAGQQVVRLKGGDSFVFGRGHEELEACREAGVPARVIPGVTSSIAVPGAAGIPVTHRGLTQGFTVVSGHVPPGHPESSLDYAALARCGTTLVFLMGVGTLDAITAELCAVGMDAATPAAVIADGTHLHQRVITASLASIAEVAHDAGIRAPAVVVIGQVVSLRRTGSP